MRKKTTTGAHTAQEIIEYFGGTRALSELLGVSPQAITMWHGFVPYSRAYEIQALSNGKFTVDRMPIKAANFLKSATAAAQ
jgi:DNA-binding transcriptional regulator Cro